MRMKTPCHPGEILRASIEEGLGLTVTAVAKRLGVYQTLAPPGRGLRVHETLRKGAPGARDRGACRT